MQLYEIQKDRRLVQGRRNADLIKARLFLYARAKDREHIYLEREKVTF